MAYVKKPIDGRTLAGRRIKTMKKLIASDLDAAAVEILQEQITNLSVVAKLCLEKALKVPDEVVDDGGNLHMALSNYLKIQSAVRGGLVSLKKFENKSPKKGLFDDTDDEE